MQKCKLCNTDFSDYVSLARHLRTHGLESKAYFDSYLKSSSDGVCKVCGSPTKFLKLSKGYSTYCSMKCRSADPEVQAKRVKTLTEKYEVTSPAQLPGVSAKISKAIKAVYDDPDKLAQLTSKRIETSLQTYGTSHPSKAAAVKAKVRDSSLQKFGAVTSLINPEVHAQAVRTNLKKFGVENPMQSKAVQAQRLKTLSANFNVNNPMKSQVVLANFEAKHGAKFPMQCPEIRAKHQLSRNAKLSVLYAERLAAVNCDFVSLDEFSRIIFKCRVCNSTLTDDRKFVFADRVDRGYSPCTKCYPKVSFVSRGETEVREFIQSIVGADAVVSNTRSVICGKELDIYIPSRKLAIEYDGLYYHREDNVGALYHKVKTEECEKLGIRLIHIFESEWESKRDIVKSRLASILGVSSRVYARRCTIQSIQDKAIVHDFIKVNHIQGSCSYTAAYGLSLNGELLAVMTLGASRFKAGETELLRYCCKLGYTVVGGASRLLKRFITESPEIERIVSYADRRWSTGNLYRQLGFKIESISEPSYFYSDGRSLENRMKFQKQSLIQKFNFSADLTEREMMARAYPDKFRIFDCGQYRCVLAVK